MKILNLTQGSDEWHAHRMMARNASEAASVMGVLGAKPPLADIIQRIKTGVDRAHSDFVESIFEDGKASENNAREAASRLAGSTLFRLVGTDDDGYLSASFDGITLDKKTTWENKLYNQTLHEFISLNQDIPDTHWPQVEQGLMVSGAERCVFTLSTSHGEIKHFHIYHSMPDRRAAIMSAWAAFDRFLKESFVEEKDIEPPVLESLPVVFVRAEIEDGMLQINSGMESFGLKAKKFISTINKTPETDEDFALLQSQVKVLENAEIALTNAMSALVLQIPALQLFFQQEKDIRKIISRARIDSSKLVDSGKTARKKRVIDSAMSMISDSIDETKKNEAITALANAGKNKKSMATFQNAVFMEAMRIAGAGHIAKKEADEAETKQESASFTIDDVTSLICERFCLSKDQALERLIAIFK